MDIVDRPRAHLVGPQLRARPETLPRLVPALWQEVWRDAEPTATHAELSDEDGTGLHTITVGRLVDAPVPGAVEVPAGRWLQHEHRGDLTGIWRTYAAMFEHAERTGLPVTHLKLDTGYRPGGEGDVHVLHLLLRDA